MIMAGNAWNETIADVNKTLANMNAAISSANGAAENARTEAEETNEQGNAAQQAANAANAAAAAALTEEAKWRGATAEAVTLDPGRQATVSVSEKDGVKHFTFGVPRGSDGKDGEKGDTGKSGVTFTLSGTTLNITTEE